MWRVHHDELTTYDELTGTCKCSGGKTNANLHEMKHEHWEESVMQTVVQQSWTSALLRTIEANKTPSNLPSINIYPGLDKFLQEYWMKEKVTCETFLWRFESSLHHCRHFWTQQALKLQCCAVDLSATSVWPSVIDWSDRVCGGLHFTWEIGSLFIMHLNQLGWLGLVLCYWQLYVFTW